MPVCFMMRQDHFKQKLSLWPQLLVAIAIMILICHMALEDHAIKRTFDFMERSPLMVSDHPVITVYLFLKHMV